MADGKLPKGRACPCLLQFLPRYFCPPDEGVRAYITLRLRNWKPDQGASEEKYQADPASVQWYAQLKGVVASPAVKLEITVESQNLWGIQLVCEMNQAGVGEINRSVIVLL